VESEAILFPQATHDAGFFYEVNMKYADKLKDPRWQKKRLEIFKRDDWKCWFCGEKSETLHVHHLHYQHEKEPWECSNENLLTLCATCHQTEFESRKEAESELILFLSVYRFSSSDLNKLLCVLGRNMNRGIDRAEDVLTKIDRLL